MPVRRGDLQKRRRAAALHRYLRQRAAADRVSFLGGVGELVSLLEFFGGLAAGFAGIGDAGLRKLGHALSYPALFEGFFDLRGHGRILFRFARTGGGKCEDGD
jgi:hypothetical protein